MKTLYNGARLTYTATKAGNRRRVQTKIQSGNVYLVFHVVFNFN